jgi:hypothetical protein
MMLRFPDEYLKYRKLSFAAVPIILKKRRTVVAAQSGRVRRHFGALHRLLQRDSNSA